MDKNEAVVLVVKASVQAAAIALAYCLPLLVAAWRQHRRRDAITRLNLLLGWTLLGWIAALAWALWPQRRRRRH